MPQGDPLDGGYSLLTRDDLIREEVTIGTDLEHAVYILIDGSLWDGQFEYGKRAVEHREAEQFSAYDRYDGDAFWIDVMVRMGLVMVIPETRVIIVHPQHRVTDAQQVWMDRSVNSGFHVEHFK